ncbi:hypothetical protein K435DRAFT_959307 [Dendrothele bispora CBS 962.96]|uniref:Uncharacterized protein n=1 Tax=Dendrothele bispora (strain CBS 962.96) TaxID=1314807 RepID=A0A4S8MZ40_DENBC|nr:hypothetical protein K435DRAFT_959307 [Dendrothele bispora CBS 962.96]
MHRDSFKDGKQVSLAVTVTYGGSKADKFLPRNLKVTPNIRLLREDLTKLSFPQPKKETIKILVPGQVQFRWLTTIGSTLHKALEMKLDPDNEKAVVNKDQEAMEEASIINLELAYEPSDYLPDDFSEGEEDAHLAKYDNDYDEDPPELSSAQPTQPLSSHTVITNPLSQKLDSSSTSAPPTFSGPMTRTRSISQRKQSQTTQAVTTKATTNTPNPKDKVQVNTTGPPNGPSTISTLETRPPPTAPRRLRSRPVRRVVDSSHPPVSTSTAPNNISTQPNSPPAIVNRSPQGTFLSHPLPPKPVSCMPTPASFHQARTPPYSYPDHPYVNPQITPPPEVVPSTSTRRRHVPTVPTRQSLRLTSGYPYAKRGRSRSPEGHSHRNHHYHQRDRDGSGGSDTDVERMLPYKEKEKEKNEMENEEVVELRRKLAQSEAARKAESDRTARELVRVEDENRELRKEAYKLKDEVEKLDRIRIEYEKRPETMNGRCEYSLVEGVEIMTTPLTPPSSSQQQLERIQHMPSNNNRQEETKRWVRLQALESERDRERERRIEAERVLEAVKRECREPFIVPALLEAFLMVDGVGTEVVENWVNRVSDEESREMGIGMPNASRDDGIFESCSRSRSPSQDDEMLTVSGGDVGTGSMSLKRKRDVLEDGDLRDDLGSDSDLPSPRVGFGRSRAGMGWVSRKRFIPASYVKSEWE